MSNCSDIFVLSSVVRSVDKDKEYAEPMAFV